MAKKRKPGRTDIRRVGEIMDEMDTPHGNFNLTEQFMNSGAAGPPGPKASQPMLAAFRNAYEPVSSEHLAQEIFTVGRLRDYFQAWIIPKMPDPLPIYIEELDYMGFPMRSSFDGSPCIMVRYRSAVDIPAEEVMAETDGNSPASNDDVMVYTDDWSDDLSDLPPFVAEENK